MTTDKPVHDAVSALRGEIRHRKAQVSKIFPKSPNSSSNPEMQKSLREMLTDIRKGIREYSGQPDLEETSN